MRKPCVGLVVILVIFSGIGCKSDPPGPLPDYSKAPYQKVEEVTIFSMIHQEWGPLKAEAYVDRVPPKVGSNLIAVYLNPDGTPRYAEWLQIKSMDVGLLSGYLFKDGKPVFEKSGEIPLR